jgi:hypothetical protein
MSHHSGGGASGGIFTVALAADGNTNTIGAFAATILLISNGQTLNIKTLACWHAVFAGGGACGGIFTVELAADGSANIVGTFPTTVVSSGAADITAAPDGKLYVVNSPSLGSSQAYEVRLTARATAVNCPGQQSWCLESVLGPAICGAAFGCE